MDPTDRKLDRLPPEVTQNIAESLPDDHEGLEAFRALRLASKELYLKTFRTFALAYFTKLSVAFNIASLHRLQEVANHKNSFGLSLNTFPTSLTCSTYRLPTGDTVRKCFTTTPSPARSEEAEEIADSISRACQKGPGLFKSFLGPYDRPRTRDLARRYMKAAEDQSLMESTGNDVKILAHALATLPNVRNIGIAPDRRAWGQDDWDSLVGIRIESFLYMEYLASGQTNLTVTTKKLLSAVAGANDLCKSRQDQLIIEQVDLQGGYDDQCNDLEPCPHNLQLHKLSTSKSLQMRLRAGLSHLKRLYISVCRITSHAPPVTDVESELQRSKTSLQGLFGNPGTEEFCLDLLEPLPSDLTTLVGLDSWLIDMAIEDQPFTRLRSIELYSIGLWNELPTVSQYVLTHAPTLKELRLGSKRGPERPDVDANREVWRPILRVAAGCTELAEFVLLIRTHLHGVYDIDIAVKGQEDVSKLLAKLVLSPTELGEKPGWVR